MFPARPTLTPQPHVGRDWFLLSSWTPVWEQLKLSPERLPGVMMPKKGGERAPFPRLVHRTHLPVLGLEVPRFQVEVCIGRWSSQLPETSPLRPHQDVAKAFILERRGSLLADECRVGKTPPVVYAHDNALGSLVIVGPVSSRLAWHEWCARRWGACSLVHRGEECILCSRLKARVMARPSFLVVEGLKPNPAIFEGVRPQAYFFNYTIEKPWSEHFDKMFPIGTLVLDEAHLAGLQGRKTRSAETLRRLNTVASRVVVATATPIFSKPAGLWPLLDIISPAAWGKFWDYAVRYADARPGSHGWRADGVSHVEEMQARLATVMLRRRWRDIQGNLAVIDRTTELVPISLAIEAEVNRLAEEIRRAAKAPQTAIGHLARLRRLFAQVKAPRAVALATEFVRAGNSTLVWAWHNDVAETMASALRAADLPVYGPISGKMAPEQREHLVGQSQSDPRSRVLVATMASLGTGVALPWASHEIFAELDWVPPTIAQAEMRPYDGKHAISSTLLVADCDVDQRLASCLVEKCEATCKVGLEPGVGTVAGTLAETFQLDEGTLSDLAERLMEDA